MSWLACSAEAKLTLLTDLPVPNQHSGSPLQASLEVGAKSWWGR